MNPENGYALVLDCPRAAVEAIQSLGRSGVRSDLVAETQDCVGFHSSYVERKLTHDFAEDFLPRMRELDAGRAYHLIVPSTEAATLQCLRLPEGDDLRRRCVMASNAAFEVAFSKAKTLELASRLGVPLPITLPVTGDRQDNEELGFPRVVKPIHSRVFASGELLSMVPAIVADREQRNLALERMTRYGEVVEQEYVTGSGVGIELLFDRGEPAWHFAHERIHELPLTGGASSYRRSIEPPREALEFSIAILKALRWHGVAMVEFKRRRDGTFVLMEINPRLWGSLALSIDCGVDFPKGLLFLAEGRKLPPQKPYRVGYYTRYLPNDVVWLGANFFADRSKPLLLMQPRVSSLLECLRPLVWKESWDHFDMQDLRVTGAVVAEAAGALLGRGKKALHRKIRRWQLPRHHREVLGRINLSIQPQPRLLFMCYGNICRSPFAAALAATRLPGQTVESAGFHKRGRRFSPAHVCEAAKEFGIRLGNHRSSVVTDEELRSADLILLMDGDNFDLLEARGTEFLRRATLLGLFSLEGPMEIKDPYEMSLENTLKVFRQIQLGIEGLRDWLSRSTEERVAKPAAR